MEELISKRELLEKTGISYGALYRWKRMQLLPDEWFIRKSTFTGSETFFPREKTLERVAQIQSMKASGMSLDEIGAAFRVTPVAVELDADEIVRAGISQRPVVEAYLNELGAPETWDFDALLQLRLFDLLLQTGGVSRQEAAQTLGVDRSAFQNAQIIGYRRLGVLVTVIAEENAQLVSDGTQVFCLQLGAEAAKLQQMLKKG